MASGGEVGMERGQSWTLTLPAEVVEAIHRVAGVRPEAFVREAIQHELRRRDQVAAIRAAAGAWQDHPKIPDTMESLIAWMRQLRAQEVRRPPSTSGIVEAGAVALAIISEGCRID